MFATFRNDPTPSSTSRSTTTSTPTSTQPAKPRRAQVKRACEECRIARTKCDQVRPCGQCRKYGRECFVTARKPRSALKARPFAPTPAETTSASEQPSVHAPPTTTPSTVSPVSIAQPAANPAATTAHAPSDLTVVSGNQSHGPLSLEYFLARLSLHLDMNARLPPPPTGLLDPLDPMNLVDLNTLNQAQQNCFMDLFWQSYHVNFPALDEDSFRSLYASLWNIDGTRQPDALVDIVMALTIQYAYFYLGLGDPTTFSADAWQRGDGEVCTAGSAFYHRCQSALHRSLEEPSIKTVQCTFFSAVYLSFSRCFRAANTMYKQAAHLASTLAVSDEQKELLQRVKECIRTQDIRLSLRLGHPVPATTLAPAAPAGPETDPTIGSGSPNSPPSEPDATLYHRFLLELCEASATIHNTLSALMAANPTIYKDPPSRNRVASLITPHLHPLQTSWPQSVPETLHVPRTNPGPAFSTSLTPLDLTPSGTSPQWLTRQRLALEAQYHAFALSLLRPFISCAPPTPSSSTLAADSLCIASVSHAIALTHLIHQGLIHTDIMTGCYQAFEWQMDAVYTLAGFASSYPVCPPTQRARDALRVAVDTFARYGERNGAALCMGKLTKDLEAKIGTIVDGFRTGLQITPPRSVGSGEESVPWESMLDVNLWDFGGGQAALEPEMISSWAFSGNQQ